MTGYGKSTAVVKGKKIHVEIKSLNSKALDLSARIVPLYREKEMEIRAMISRTLERGKVDFTIWVEKDDTQTATPINGVILDNYYQQIKQISEERHIPLPADWFATLLRLPDVMTRTEVEELDEEEWTAVRTAIEEAIGKLVDFRKQEGAALQRKFTEKIQNIGDLLKSIEPYEQSRTERIRQRLVESLGNDSQCGIRQEPPGAGTHLLHRKAGYQRGEAAPGKPLALLPRDHARRTRQARSSGHRSGDGPRNQHHRKQVHHAEMQNIVVKMKDELEQIKEQVLNVM